MFEDVGHSTDARDMMKDLLIGELAEVRVRDQMYRRVVHQFGCAGGIDFRFCSPTHGEKPAQSHIKRRTSNQIKFHKIKQFYI